MWKDTREKFTKFFKIEFMNMIGIMIIWYVSIDCFVWSRDEQHTTGSQQPLKFLNDFLLPRLIALLNTFKACNAIESGVWKCDGFCHVTLFKIEGRMLIARPGMLQ